MERFRKVWNIFSTVVVAAVVILAILLAGVRLFGLQVYTVLSPSMEPAFHVGSLIYVKKTEPADVKVGDPITFVLNESLTVATHRVISIETDEDGALLFRTKGDANETADGGAVHEKNLLGVPVFTIPYLGYLAAYIQDPKGRVVCLAAAAALVFLLFLPDIIGGSEKEEDVDKEESGE